MGSLNRRSDCQLCNAESSQTGPNRPTNIRMMTATSRRRQGGVSPVDSPTVLKGGNRLEHVGQDSSRAIRYGPLPLSKAARIMVPVPTNKKRHGDQGYHRVQGLRVQGEPPDAHLPLSPGSCAHTKPHRARKVVVLMPPAQEPGEPPTIMSNSMKARETLVMDPISTVLNPAVRLVTDWNSEDPEVMPETVGRSSRPLLRRKR